MAMLEADTIVALRALSGTAINKYAAVRGKGVIADGNAGLFAWDPVSVANDDGRAVIRPTAIAVASPGRWVMADKSWRDSIYFAEEFGVAPGNTAAANTTAINAMDDALSTLSFSDGFWRTVVFPAGIIRHDGTLQKRNYVNWIGQGRDATQLLYTGTTGTAVAVKGTGVVGDKNERRKVKIAEMKVSGSTGNTAVGIETAWVVRAFEFLENVTIIGFGGHGLLIGQSTFDSSFKGVEIIACGTAPALGAAGLARVTVAAGIAALTFHDLKVEASGSALSVGGGIGWGSSTAATNKTEGLWFTGLLRVQNNLGASESFVANTSSLGFQDVYVESDNLAKIGLSFEDSNISINGMARFGGSAANTIAIKLNSNCEAYLSNYPVISPSNYALDFSLNNTSFLVAPPSRQGLPHRTSRDASSELQINGKTHGVFDGSPVTGFVSGSNYTVTRTAVGQYALVFKKPLPNASYTVVGNAQKSDNSAFYMFGFANRTANSVSLAVTNFAGAFTDANRVSFDVIPA
jgi:hypothetical protein